MYQCQDVRTASKLRNVVNKEYVEFFAGLKYSVSSATLAEQISLHDGT